MFSTSFKTCEKNRYVVVYSFIPNVLFGESQFDWDDKCSYKSLWRPLVTNGSIGFELQSSIPTNIKELPSWKLISLISSSILNSGLYCSSDFVSVKTFNYIHFLRFFMLREVLTFKKVPTIKLVKKYFSSDFCVPVAIFKYANSHNFWVFKQPLICFLLFYSTYLRPEKFYIHQKIQSQSQTWKKLVLKIGSVLGSVQEIC